MVLLFLNTCQSQEELKVEQTSLKLRKMLSAWYMDPALEGVADQREPQQMTPNKPCELEELAKLGVLYWHLDADNYENDEEYKSIRATRGYDYEDCITVSKEKLENYEAKLKIFFEEHIHEDEEIRFCIEGSGYFDVRSTNDEWIRIEVNKGDMIVLPEGIYHRFTLDQSNYIKAVRLFRGVPIWTPYNRPQDENESRLKYVSEFLNNDIKAN